MNEKVYIITREKHLDHLVKVVPIIVLGYALQCYFLGQYNHLIGSSTLTFLGLALGGMIGGFILYDVKYRSELNDQGLKLSFYSFEKTVFYSEIISVDIINSKETFGAAIFHTKTNGKIRLYFVDDPDKIKSWLDSKINSPQSLAA